MKKEIKVGDKVRVSKDAPRMYIGGIDFCFTEVVSEVKVLDDDNAALKCEATHTVLAIPTKYLVKVEEETPRIKVGDRVIISPEAAKTLPDLPECHRNLIYRVTKIIDYRAIVEGLGKQICLPLSYYILIEPKEQTVEEKSDIADRFDWQAYSAELAKEIVLKLVGKNNDEKMLAEYATNIAKSVVENLKKK